MSELTPLGESEVVILEFEYEVSDEYIERTIVADGIAPPQRWQLSINLAHDLSEPALRRRLRDVHARYLGVSGFPELPGPTDDPVEFLAAIEPWLDVVAMPEEAPEDVARRKEHFQSEKRRWISRYGSERLQAGTARGYKTDRLYALERAAVEVPGAWVDTSASAEWRDRTDPSGEALEMEGIVSEHIEALGSDLQCRIVWLTEPPRDMARKLDIEGLAFANQEAITIAPFLDRYVLILPLDVDGQNEGEHPDTAYEGLE